MSVSGVWLPSEMSILLSRRIRSPTTRKHNKTGRNRHSERFVKLNHWMLKSTAWRSLSPAARALYVELAQRYNGFNNGEISMSVREAARLVNVAKDTVTKCFRDLEAKGFIRRNVCGSFNYKLRHATTWILTEHDFDGKSATKDFMRWKSDNSEPGPRSGPKCPKSGTPFALIRQNWPSLVLRLGPWVRFCTVARSQITARI